MATSGNLARFYVQDVNALPVKIWIMDGAMPYPEWPDADMVFVVHPPPLDIPVLAQVWQHGRTLVLVSTKLDQQATGQGPDPPCEFFALPDVGAVLTHLRQQQAAVFFLSFQQRRWYRDWLPQKEYDAFVVDGAHCRFYFDAYTPYEGSFEFDDAYRRISLRECTFAQSTNHFLHVLETLPYTALPDAQMKKSLFQGLFPFYTGQPLGPDVQFDWRGSPESLRRAIVGEELQRHLPTYALALACLSEVGAAFTHRGRHDLYLAVVGDLVQLRNGQVLVGAFTPEQRTLLRTAHPFLYLHVFYRLPNQFLVATMDEVRDALHNTAIIAAAEDLLHRLVTRESALHFVKRTYELVALSGTLCQLKTFAARFHSDRPRLLAAKEDGLRAAHYARADDVSRDLNYWILAVLTDWVLFPEQVQAHPADLKSAALSFFLAALLGLLLFQQPLDVYVQQLFTQARSPTVFLIVLFGGTLAVVSRQDLLEALLRLRGAAHRSPEQARLRNEAAVFCLLRRFDRWTQRTVTSHLWRGVSVFCLTLANFVSSAPAVLFFKALWAPGQEDFVTQAEDRALAAGILYVYLLHAPGRGGVAAGRLLGAHGAGHGQSI
jgi:hypothetical protein